MYIEKELVRGYNAYLDIDVNNGEGSMMDAGILVLEAGDRYTFHEEQKELAWILFSGRLTVVYPGGTAEINRPNPFDYSTWCLHLCAGADCTLWASAHCEIYVQKTWNDQKFPARLYRPEDTHTWRRGGDEECGGCTKRDVRTSFDYEIAPYSNMVLGEVVNLPGKWSSYPPHWHLQPEVYCYYFARQEGFGAGWGNGALHELHHHGMLVITHGTHPQVMAPGYPCCYTWGIRHLPDNPWKKTRIDDPVHAWLLSPEATFWDGEKTPQDRRPEQDS